MVILYSSFNLRNVSVGNIVSNMNCYRTRMPFPLLFVFTGTVPVMKFLFLFKMADMLSMDCREMFLAKYQTRLEIPCNSDLTVYFALPLRRRSLSLSGFFSADHIFGITT